MNIFHIHYNFRHIHSSNLLMNNFPFIQLSNRLRHADLDVTLNFYTHLVVGMEVKIKKCLKK